MWFHFDSTIDNIITKLIRIKNETVNKRVFKTPVSLLTWLLDPVKFESSLKILRSCIEIKVIAVALTGEFLTLAN